jgi:hypothetical protein
MPFRSLEYTMPFPFPTFPLEVSINTRPRLVPDGPCHRGLVKDILVDIKEPEVSIFIDPAEAGILVAQ